MPHTSDLEQLLRGADLRVTRPRLAVLAAVHAHPHADTDALIGAVRTDLARRLAPGGVRRPAGADDRRPRPPDPADRLGRALRVARRRQPPPRGLPRAAAPSPTSTAPSATPLVSPRRRTTASRSTRPRSSTGECVPTVSSLISNSERKHVSESENPVIDAPEAKEGRAAHQQGLVAQPAGPQRPAPARAAGQPARRRLRLRRRVREARRRRAQGRHRRGAQHLAGLVARRLRPLRRPVHPAELARRRHLPDRGRPRWRR